MRLRAVTAALFAVLAVAQVRAQEAEASQPAGTSLSTAQPSREIQEPEGFLPPGEDPENRLGLPLLRHFAQDQQTFWTSPFRLHTQDLRWILPSTAFLGGVIASDSWLARQVPDSPSQLKRSRDISNYATFSLMGVTSASSLLGIIRHNDHLREAGLLSDEAAVNSIAIDYLLKFASQRPRPLEGNGHGSFFQGGAAFPSEHAASAWAAASVWAHEYPGTLSQILAYGLASTVTLTRVTSKEHFPSDALIGSALGWYLGRQVYRAHHDPEIGGAPWGSLLREPSGERVRKPDSMGSPDVPLESWIYPALERLAALGYIDSAYLGIRPWTRMECARLLEEAGEKLAGREDSEAGRILEAVNAEFGAESARLAGAANLGAAVDAVYTRAAAISGPPLTDGYHFGQTIINDYGRPYGEGFNNVTGAIVHAEAGPLAFYARGEYQRAPAVPSAPAQALQDIANADLTLPLPNGKPEASQFDLLEASVVASVHNLRISFGKQSQWLGTGESGSLLMTDNAEPILMLKVENVFPLRLPAVSRVLGPVRAEYFIGRLAGHQFELNGNQLLGPGNISPQPFLDGAKISFRPTANFEFGMAFTAQFVGPGLPFTWRDFLRTFYVHNQTGTTAAGSNPAKRASSADFSYRVPGLRNWLTVYGEALAVDEISPIGSSRATVNPGIYMPRFPKLERLQLRAEGVHEPLTSEFAPGFVYYGVRRYRSGYTNDGNLMGNWIGRAGRGGQAWLTYWLSPRSNLQGSYRLQEVSKDFLGGGRLADYSAGANLMVSRDLSVSGSVQYEQWRFPLLSNGTQSNVTTSVQLTFYPQKLSYHR